MEETNEGEDQGDVDATDEGEETGVATELGLELVEGAKAFFGLGEEIGIGLEGTEPHGVVDVTDGDMAALECLA